MTDTTDVQPEPQQAAPVVPVAPDPVVVPEAASEPETAAEEAAEPVTVSDDNGQHVVMGDGSVVYTRSHNFPVTNTEQEAFEITHSGDQERYSLKPGDLGYNPFSDPSIPNSHLATQVQVQLASFGERVKDDPNARPSVTWDALQPTYQGALKSHADTGVGTGNIVE